MAFRPILESVPASAKLYTLVRQSSTDGFDANIRRDNVEIRARRTRDIRLPPQASLLHSLANLLGEKLLGQLSNILVDVQVLGGGKESIRGLHVSPILSRSSVLVHVNDDMGRKLSKELLDVARLLASELDVVAVGIVVCRQCALEVKDAVGVVSRKDDDVKILEHLGCPLGLGVKLAQESEEGFIAGGLIAMDSALDPDADLVLGLGSPRG